MGGDFGECLSPDCCWGTGPDGKPKVATGVGFWGLEGCEGEQPLPTMWEDPLCVDSVMGQWKQTAAAAWHHGYKYLTTPLVAWNISYAEDFIKKACQKCTSIECDCPNYVGFHFYAYDCQPIALGGYAGFQARLNEVKDIMERYPFIKGAIMNEVGMLNCQSSEQNPICVPDTGRYPASSTHDGSCPITDELPNGMASFMDGLFDMIINTKTSDGRDVVKAFSWFMLGKAGGTYNQQLFNGNDLNELGEAYIRNCQRWEQAQNNTGHTQQPPAPAPACTLPQVPLPAPMPPPAPYPHDPATDTNWGCGLLGEIPGINSAGIATPETQRLIDGVKGSSTLGKVNYWNWQLVPDVSKGEYLTEDFIFMPEQWGHGVAEVLATVPAGSSNFTLTPNGTARSPASMADIFMGSNEPDIVGSCMGGEFGSCLGPECCWGTNPDGTEKVATGVGFWAFDGCIGEQPLPHMWDDQLCVDSVIGQWKQTAAAAKHRGYKYLTTPLVAYNIKFVEKFIIEACSECQTIDCGCPQYIGFHFYGYDCQPETLGGYAGFQARLDQARDLMEKYPFLKGVIVNEVGMLNCQSSEQNPICVPGNGRYPAADQPNNMCPFNEELPNGMASFMDRIFDMMIASKTSDGRDVVKAFSWFMLDQVGGTYNMQLFNGNALNDLGEAYIRNCQRWEQAQQRR